MKPVKHRDARSLDHATLEEMRRLAVRRVLAGESQGSVARSFEVHPHSVARWMAQHRHGGPEALKARKATGRPPTLTRRQMEALKRVIVGKNPQQLNFGPALWTLPLVGELVEQKFGIVLHKTTIARMLRNLGLSPQKPVRRAFLRDEDECVRWMRTDFPRIVREARRRQATILFEDETGIHEDGPVGRTWGVRGRTPVVRVTGQRRRSNVISAISPRGRVWFRCYGGTLNAARFIEFLKALLHDVRGSIELILDRHPAHVAASVRRFVHAHRSRLRVHYLPAYAPDLNPDEHVWAYIKGTFRRDPLSRDEDFAEAVNASMDALQDDPELVRGFFRHPEVAYVREALHW
jgi:transposase